MNTSPVQDPDAWGAVEVVPGPGAGTLARFGSVVLLVGSDDPAVVKAYVDNVAMVAANGSQGRQLVRSFALMLSTAAEPGPAFAAIAPHTTGLAVLVEGDATVTVDDEVVSGSDSLAWVERLVAWPVERVTATLGGTSAPDPTHSPYRLEAGVVPAGGFAIGTGGAGSPAGDRPAGTAAALDDELSATIDAPEPAAEAASEPTPAPRPAADLLAKPADPAPAPAPPSAQPSAEEGEMTAALELDDMISRISEVEEHAAHQPPPGATPSAPSAPSPPPAAPPRPVPAPPADEQVSFQSVLISDVPDDDQPVPLPIVDDASQVVNEEAPQEEVRGVYCKNRHFNDPRQLFCAVCGINMVQQTPVLVSGLRPPLGVIVLDDGAVFQLDTPYLLGRDPGADERVRSGSFRALPVIDQSNQVSRVHARLELRGWDVVLVDNDSTNGTYVHVPRTPDFIRMPPGAEQVLVQGTRIRIGHRVLAFNTHSGSSN